MAVCVAAMLGVVLAVAVGGAGDQAHARPCGDRDPSPTITDPTTTEPPVDVAVTVDVTVAARTAADVAALRACRDDDEDDDDEEPELEVVHTAAPLPPAPGRPLTYFVTVVNVGSTTASGVSLRVTTPEGAELRGVRPEGACSTGDGLVSCPLGSLGDGESRTIEITVVPRGNGPLVSRSTVDSEQTDEETGESVVELGSEALPVLNSTVVAGAVGGIVLVREPGSTTFRQLGPGEPLPLGAIIDTRRGRVRIVAAADAQGSLQSAEFFAGTFQVVQLPGPPPVTELRLVGGSFAACPPPAGSASAAGFEPRARAAQVRRPVRRLWGTGTGRFRTRGRFGAATIRGTHWLVSDRCDGTLVVARQGSVVVLDFARRKSVVLRAIAAYLIRRPVPGAR